MKKIRTVLFYFYYRLFLTSDEKKLIENLEDWRNGFEVKNHAHSKDEIFILMETPEDYFYLIKFYIFYCVLRVKYKRVNVDLICLGNRLGHKGKLAFLKKLKVFDRKWIKLYSMLFKGEIVFSFRKKINYSEQHYQVAKKIFNNLKTKQDVLDIIYDGYKIGPLIYDHFLRVESVATVNVKSSILEEIIYLAIYSINSLQNIFKSKKYKYFLTSYVTYITHGVPSLVALRSNVSVFASCYVDQFFSEIQISFFSNSKNYLRYKSIKNELSESELKIAENAIAERFQGKIDLATCYMRKSSYNIQHNNLKRTNDKPAVVIFLHCFFDSPHLYREMLFPDFYEWLQSTLLFFSKCSEVEIYIKKHPNALEGNNQIINEILSNFKKVKVLSEEMNNVKLVDTLNLIAAITVHGTITHELAYLGIPVICAGDHPHIDFNFHLTPESVDQYFKVLKDVIQGNNSRMLNKEKMKEEVLRFFYMHNYYMFPEKLTSTEQEAYNLLLGLLFEKYNLAYFNEYEHESNLNILAGKLINQL